MDISLAQGSHTICTANLDSLGLNTEILVKKAQVEIRGKHMKGQITEQDIIIVREKFKKGKIFNPKNVIDKTLGVEVGLR